MDSHKMMEHRDRHAEREAVTKTYIGRQKEREGDGDRVRHTDTDGQSDRQMDEDRERTDTERQIERKRHMETDRQAHRERNRHRSLNMRWRSFLLLQSTALIHLQCQTPTLTIKGDNINTK